MLDSYFLLKIKNNEIKSRRGLSKALGVTQLTIKMRKYLDKNKLLVPVIWNKNKVIVGLKKLEIELNRIPVASDNWNLTKHAQKYFSTWNNALITVFGQINQHRYCIKDRDEAATIIKQFITKYKRLPLRKEFDGKDFPYFEAITTAFNLNKWSDILQSINLEGLDIRASKKHGTGTLTLYKNILFLSHEEYLIGKYLLDNNIKFEKEVKYCENCTNKYLYDFYIPQYNFYIEYYGLSHLESYKKRIVEKQKHYHNNIVLEIFKHDNTINKLANYIKVQRL